jgi:hypothetical protein
MAFMENNSESLTLFFNAIDPDITTNHFKSIGPQKIDGGKNRRGHRRGQALLIEFNKQSLTPMVLSLTNKNDSYI